MTEFFTFNFYNVCILFVLFLLILFSVIISLRVRRQQRILSDRLDIVSYLLERLAADFVRFELNTLIDDSTRDPLFRSRQALLLKLIMIRHDLEEQNIELSRVQISKMRELLRELDKPVPKERFDPNRGFNA